MWGRTGCPQQFLLGGTGRVGKPSVCIGWYFPPAAPASGLCILPTPGQEGRESWQPLVPAWSRLRKNDCDRSYAFQSHQLASF